MEIHPPKTNPFGINLEEDSFVTNINLPSEIYENIDSIIDIDDDNEYINRINIDSQIDEFNELSTNDNNKRIENENIQKEIDLMSANENVLIFKDIIDNIKENIEQIELDRFQFENTIDEQKYLIMEEFLDEMVRDVIDISIIGEFADDNSLKFRNTSLADVEKKIPISDLEKITPKHMFWVLGSSIDPANISLSENNIDNKSISYNISNNSNSQERLKLGLGFGHGLGLGLSAIDDSIDDWNNFQPPHKPLHFEEVMNKIILKNKERKKI